MESLQTQYIIYFMLVICCWNNIIEQHYRKYESLYKKKINKLWALNFKKTCINNAIGISKELIHPPWLFVYKEKDLYPSSSNKRSDDWDDDSVSITIVNWKSKDERNNWSCGKFRLQLLTFRWKSENLSSPKGFRIKFSGETKLQL